ncbi:hypothetical protein [Ensifer sp. Root31]|uniref:hypothetical protein n=1 Tax=Ensifer sp. Root31 TaxID=1736512 RepID=UPI0012E7EE73|nr:hypothetical protein [Ensifer sp. Root31]
MTVNAQTEDQLVLEIVDVTNRYSVAVISARLCGKFAFSDDAESEAFMSNYRLAKVYAARVFMEAHPNATRDQLVEKAQSMDRQLEKGLKKFHAAAGCSHEIIRDDIRWFTEFRTIPQQRFPDKCADFTSFRALAGEWLKTNRVR